VSEAPYYVIFALLHVVVPAVGVFAAGMLAVGAVSPAKRWVTLVYGVVTAAVAITWTILYWWPGDAWWNGFHLVASATCLAVVALMMWMWRARPRSVTARTVRPILVGDLVVSAVVFFLLVAGGSGK
jgi:hypothetical protein